MRSRWPNLRRAPIAEALIDLRVESEVELDRLLEFHEQIKDQYPKRRDRFQYESSIRFEPGRSPKTDTSGGQNGFFFDSGDKTFVAQARTDGFTLSRLPPYEDWNNLQTEARRLWEIYRSHVHPSRGTRAAVRYINRIQIPPQIESLEDWFVTRPNMPSLLGKIGPGFMLRLVGELQQHGAKAIVMFMTQPGLSADELTFVLDIDVFSEQSFDPSADDVWEQLDQLRDIKNDIFFQSITTQLLHQLEPAWSEDFAK